MAKKAPILSLKEITKKVEGNKDRDNIANIIIDVFKTHFDSSEDS